MLSAFSCILLHISLLRNSPVPNRHCAKAWARVASRNCSGNPMKTETLSLPYTQTRSFLTIALIELWERFGYYGMQALIVYYMVERLGFEDSRANLVWSA